jgi:hypothetical protein
VNGRSLKYALCSYQGSIRLPSGQNQANLPIGHGASELGLTTISASSSLVIIEFANAGFEDERPTF